MVVQVRGKEIVVEAKVTTINYVEELKTALSGWEKIIYIICGESVGMRMCVQRNVIRTIKTEKTYRQHRAKECKSREEHTKDDCV